MKQIQKWCENEAEQKRGQSRVSERLTKLHSVLFCLLQADPCATPGICSVCAAFQSRRTAGQVPPQPVAGAERRKLRWKVGVQERSVSAAFAEDIGRPCSSRPRVNEQPGPRGKLSVAQDAGIFLLGALLQLMPQT